VLENNKANSLQYKHLCKAFDLASYHLVQMTTPAPYL
jgi:hypothetical protein